MNGGEELYRVHAERNPSRSGGHAARAWSADDLAWHELDMSLLSRPVRRALARIYAHVLQAECLGAQLSLAVVEAAPEGILRDAARSQHREERNHVAFFARLTSALGAEASASVSLNALRTDLRELRDYRSLMLAGAVLENAANALFVGNGRRILRRLRSSIRLPGTPVLETLLRAVTELVGGDEARHVAFGMRVLRADFANITARELHVAEQQVQHVAALVQSAFGELEAEFRVLGLGRGEVLSCVATAQERYYRHLQIDPALRTHGGEVAP